MCVVTASFQYIRCCHTRRAGTLQIERHLVHLEEDVEEDGVMVNANPLSCVRRAVWGMLYADEGGIVHMSAEGLTKMMTVIVTVLEAAGLTVSEKT